MYYTLLNLFTFTMYCVTVFDNLGFMWVAVEMTTAYSAFLVGFTAPSVRSRPPGNT